MKASVIVPFYNQESLVRRVVESALSQDFDDYEVVFLDDASTDGTYRELEKCVREFKGFQGRGIRCLRNENNLGIIGAYNRLMAESTGELCIVQCGDDLAHSNRVSEIVRCWNEAVREHPDLVAAQTKCRMVDVQMRPFAGTDVSRKGTARWRVLKGKDAWEQHFLFHGATAVYSRKLIDQFGPMDPAAKIEDVLMRYRAILSGSILLIDEVLLDYRCVKGASSTYHTTLCDMVEAAKRDIVGIRQLMRDLDLARPVEYDRYAADLERWMSVQTLFLKLLTARGVEKLLAGKEVLRLAMGDPSMRRYAVFALPRPFVSVIVWIRGTIGNLCWRFRVRRLEKLLDFEV